MENRTIIVCLLKLLAAMLVTYMVRSEDEGEVDERETCQGNNHVCTTLMKYPDGYVANEGPYCKCSAGDCGSAWSEDDGRALTWKHYERVHWMVQYRFCKPLEENRPVCGKGKRAAVIKTELVHWKPYIENVRCRCPEGVHHMTGWKKDGNVWKYFYHCDKKECEHSDSECARILVDANKKSDIVREVIFSCVCQHGYLCPAKIKDETKVEGKEVVIRCEKVQQSNNKNEKLKQSKVNE